MSDTQIFALKNTASQIKLSNKMDNKHYAIKKMRLERQIIIRIAGQKIGCGRCGRRYWSSLLDSGLLCRGAYTFHFPGTDAVEPTILPLARINVERYRQFLAHLNVKLFYLVVSEYFEAHSARVLVMILNDVFLSFPFVSCLRHSAPGLEYGNNSSCKFHNYRVCF